MDDFLGNLGNILGQQFGVAENKNRSLDILNNGTVARYGQLGDFAKQIDTSAERSYTEQGMFRTDTMNSHAKNMQILMQEPTATVLIKKRAFSSLAENYRPDLMNDQERLLYRATKVLFQNKCKQISDFEKLSKISSIASKIGSVDYHLLPVIFGAVDSINSNSPTNTLADSGSLGQLSYGGSFTKLKSVIEKIRRVTNFSQDQVYTTWLTDSQQIGKNYIGDGTGVIELTTNMDISTTTSVQFGGGSCRLNISDSYGLMVITNMDIDKALSDTRNAISNNTFLQFGTSSLMDLIQSNKSQLNAARASRGANPINFITSPNTFLGKQVIAIIDATDNEIKFTGSAFSVEIDDLSLNNGELGNDGLNNGNEVDLFKQIVESYYNYLQINQNSRSQIKTFNASPEVTYARQKMRMYYGSKLIIQPMDVVHVYMGSKTKVDEKVLGGAQEVFNSYGFLSSANNVLKGVRNLLSLDKNQTSLEKSIFVGSDFPNWLWGIVRNQFIADKDGAHVFAGIVDSSSSQFSNGVTTVNVQCSDNTKYFDFGVVNIKPSLENFNGSLYDPLTPFNIKFDNITGFQKDSVPPLLDENKVFLTSSSFVKYKNGLYAGMKPTENSFSQDADRLQNNSIRRVFYDPDGFVYKWKEGIGSIVLFGDSYSEKTSLNSSVPSITSDPFAGQDIMNVLSLLITGEPYNFATFYNAASKFNSFSRDLQTGEDPATSYFKNLQTDLKSRNLIYGNFVPFKNLTMDEDSYKNILNNQTNATNSDNELASMLQKRSELADKIIKNATDPTQIALISEVTNAISELDININKKKQDIVSNLTKSNSAQSSLIGNDISFDSNQFLETKDKNSTNDPKVRKELRKKINFLTRRLIWKVRENEDVNLFIVDDTYDKDQDIQAFEKSFTNPELFSSEYTNVSSKIRDLAAILGLEVFADTQGNIQIRSPRYNRMPSSVFYKMLKLKDDLGIQLFPQFLEDLYVNQINGALSRIESIEDEIRLYCYALSKPDDASAIDFISSAGQLGTGIPNNEIPFKFLSNEYTGKIAPQDVSNIIVASENNSDLDTKLSDIKTQSGISNIFSNISRANILQSSIAIVNGNLINNFLTISELTSRIPTLKTKIDNIINRLYLSTGQMFDINQFFKNSNEFLGGTRVSSVDVLSMTNAIASRIAERQNLLKIAAKSIAKAKEGQSLAENKDNLGNKLIFSDLSENSNLPQSFEYLIEDENYDDFGPNSGKRYVIRNMHIKNLSISEKPPEFSAVRVIGRFGDNFFNSSDLPSDINAFSGGNALTSAEAVDYDLWRMYGIRLPHDVPAPFLTDPNSQLSPYAVSLLTTARQTIFTGSADIVGNEFMQPGEVVYLENRDILFYVERVNHNFSYKGNFTTTLDLSYGHSVGTYIPTRLDVAGKILNKNKDISNYSHVKEGNVFNQEHLGTIVGNYQITPSTIADDIMNGPYGKHNQTELLKIINSAQSALSGANDNYMPTLEVRIFYDTSNSNFSKPSEYAKELHSEVYKSLIGSNHIFEKAGVKGPDNFLKTFSDNNQLMLVEVDASSKAFTTIPGTNTQVSEFRYPSSKSYYLAKKAIGDTNNNDNIQVKIDTLIYNYVVDVWVVYKNNINKKING